LIAPSSHAEVANNRAVLPGVVVGVIDGMDVNAEMLRTGNAWTYRRYADDPAYCTYEQAARDLGRGL